jgi:CheY-like chemotaxis protein
VSAAGVQISQRALQAQQSHFAEVLAAELGARLDRKLTFAATAMRSVSALELTDGDSAVVHQKLRLGDGRGFAHVVMPGPDAALLAALERRVGDDALQTARAAEIDDESRKAFAQVMESLVDVMRTAFETADLPALAVDETALVENPQSDPSWIDDCFHLRLRYSMTVEGFEDGRLDLLFEQAHVAADGARSGSICFVTMGESERKRIAALEPSLGVPVATVQPHELAQTLDERVLDATVLVIPWEIAGRSGLELAESLGCDPRLADLSILVGVTRPTRPRLLAALRAGARRLIAHPYQPDEIRSVVAPPATEVQP